jgi:hypothetical protein
MNVILCNASDIESSPDVCCYGLPLILYVMVHPIMEWCLLVAAIDLSWFSQKFLFAVMFF